MLEGGGRTDEGGGRRTEDGGRRTEDGGRGTEENGEGSSRLSNPGRPTDKARRGSKQGWQAWEAQVANFDAYLKIRRLLEIRAVKFENIGNRNFKLGAVVSTHRIVTGCTFRRLFRSVFCHCRRWYAGCGGAAASATEIPEWQQPGIGRNSTLALAPSP